jgi:uncharacterized cofD-like protein
LLEREPDPVRALAQVGKLVGSVGRVLPMSPVPLDLVAEADRFDPEDPHRTRRIRGQSSIAATPGRVCSVRLLPPGAPACATAVDAVREADLVVLGPGSWFTSVIPHLLLHELGRALAVTGARVVVTMNLVPQVGETDDYSPPELLRILLGHAATFGGLNVDTVIADLDATPDVKELNRYTGAIGARLVVTKLAADDSTERHDPKRLSGAFKQALAARAPNEGEQQTWQ